MLHSKKYIYYLLLLYACIGGLSIYFFNGTGDDGDSVTHFMFAKYAPFQPALYFDHWAKPVFVLLASPFAQFGFNGVKVFNLMVTLLTIFFTYHIALKLNRTNARVVAIIMMATPLYFILTFSSLTEPLFAFFLAIGILLCLREKFILAILLLSFLPYVRSEGLIILGVFFIYLLLKKKWTLIPLLGFGSVIYGIAGYFVYHDFFWVITKIPYASLNSVYGNGPLFHFVTQLMNVLGVPIYCLFSIGLISLSVKTLRNKILLEEKVLILMAFLIFFTAHSLFWFLGIFNSMGLIRVFLAIMPVMAIVALDGYNFIIEELWGKRKKIKQVLSLAIIMYICCFPFTPNPSAIHWQKDMMLSEKQILAKRTADFILSQKKEKPTLWYNNIYLSLLLNRNHFDSKQRRNLITGSLNELKEGDYLIWDKRFVEKDIFKADIDRSANFKLVYSAINKTVSGDTLYAVYQRN